MRTRPGLGSTALTAVGCGDVSLTTAANRGLDRGTVERALHHALELGVTVVDVHPGEADAEKLAADVVRAERARDRVVTAVTIPHVPPRPGGPPRRDLLPELLPARYVQAQVEAALRTTRLDALPLAQLPLLGAWRTSTAYAELAGTATRLVREGKVLAWGARLDIVDEAALGFAAEPWLGAVSAVMNVCDRSADALLDAKLPVLARQPLAGGMLAGNVAPGVTLRPRDDRNAIAAADLARAALLAAKLAPELRAQPPAARATDAARAQLEKGVRPEQLEATDLAELALRFVIDRGAIALPRLHRHEHVLPAVIAASAPPLSTRLLDLLLACSV